MNDNGTLSFATAIDTSGFEEGVARMEAMVSETSVNVEQESARIKEAFSSFPQVNIDVVTNAATSLETIDAAFAQIDAVVNENQSQIRALEAEYQRLSKAAGDAFMSGKDDEYREISQTMSATKELIKARRQAVDEAGKLSDELVQVEKNLKKEAAATIATEGKTKTLRNQIMELTLALAEMEMQGKSNTQEFRDMQQKAAMLQDQMGDTRTQIQVLANDEAGFAGMMSVMSGVSGGFTALTGAMSLFGSENENVQKIMVRLQSVMAITMGLQQVAQMLNKDSAASIVVLNGLKQWWANITMQATGAQIAETAATEADTAATIANSAATATNATATAAQTAADVAQATASTGAAVAETAQTTAVVAETGAAVAGTAANWSLAAAFRAVGLAIKSIPVFGWIAAGVSAIIGIISWFSSESEEAKLKAEEAKKAQEDWFNSIAEKATKPVSKIKQLAKEWKDLGNDMKAKEEFVRKNADAFKELGAQIKGVADAEALLSNPDNVQKFIESQIEKARAAAYIEQAEANIKKLIAAEEAYAAMPDTKREWVVDGYAAGGYQIGHYADLPNKEKKKKAEELEALRTEIEQGYADAAAAEVEGLRLLEAAGVSATQEYAEGSLGAIEQAIALKQAALKELTSNEEYEAALAEIEVLKGQANRITGGRAYGGGGGGVVFDKKKSQLEQRLAAEQWAEEMEDFLRDARINATQAVIDAMAEGMDKEIAQINENIEAQKRAWTEGLMALAAAKKESERAIFMSKKGATDVKWYNSEAGKKSIEEYAQDLLLIPEIAAQNQTALTNIEAQGERERAAVRKSYRDALIDEYGTTEQKLEKLERVWAERLATIPSEFLPQAMETMAKEISALKTEGFKDSINWDAVFGDLGEQSADSIAYSLTRVKEYFESAKDSMSTEDIKNFTEAIKNMENEIASRSPFSAFKKSIEDITSSKEAFVAAIQEMADAQAALTIAQNEYNEAQIALQELQAQVDAGTMAENAEQYVSAQERLTQAQNGVVAATERSNRAEQNALTARNNITSSYKNFATQLKSVGGVISGLGENAKNLAGVFSSKVANGIGKALDVLDSVMNAADTCINALADTGKSVSAAMVQTASASGTAMQATATASATAISTVEKASVILAIISAALQVATAIAGLFNNDEELQEHIDGLQGEIDALQWQIDNLEAVKLEETLGNTFENVRDIIRETNKEVYASLRGLDEYGDYYTYWYHAMTLRAEAYGAAVDKIAEAYAGASYTADKMLGSAKWDNAKDTMSKYAEQMVKVREQISDEEEKKDSDQSAIDGYKQQMAEIAQEMAVVINEMVEGIIGGSAADIASQLGDAFFEACMNGEDAMEAWGAAAKDIIRDVIKQMLVSKFLEQPLGEIFDKYKAKWFGSDGTFNGIDAVIDSMAGFSADLDAVGSGFSQIWEALPDSVTDWFANDERSGTSKGIATASQESVDENNARLTTIQAHTYTLVQGVNELNATGNMMLERLAGIEEHTQNSAESLADALSQVRSMRNTLEDMQTRGIKIL